MIYRVIDTNDCEKLMNEHRIHSLLAKIICSFDYSDDEIASFFSPLDYFEFDENIYEPIKLELEKIKREKQKVFIFGDYDCDGICSTTIMKKILDKLQIESGYYIPNRQKEGYGLNLSRLQQAYQKGYRVLITVDNGVSALEPLKWAREHGMTVIVTDHHVITESFDYNYLLHPSVLPKDYQYLCGAGVAYTLALYLGVADDAMAVLAMLATISDVMSLKGINIRIVNDGLNILNNRGYSNLLMLDSFTYPITEDDMAFKIAPKINAAGRLADQADVNQIVRYLLSSDALTIAQGAQQIKNLNAQRQQLSLLQSKKVEEMLDDNDVVNVVYSKEFHEGLLGLIASKIAKQTNKVTFIFTEAENAIKGSGRGVKGIDLMDALEGFKDRTIHFGGHSQACGITMEKQYLNTFKQFIREKVLACQVDDSEGVIDIQPEELNNYSCAEVFQYRPYGQDRRIPLIKTKIKGYSSYSSLKNDYQLKWVCPGITFISFADNKGYQYYKGMDEIEVVGELKENNFKGNTSYQLLIKEILE